MSETPNIPPADSRAETVVRGMKAYSETALARSQQYLFAAFFAVFLIAIIWSGEREDIREAALLQAAENRASEEARIRGELIQRMLENQKAERQRYIEAISSLANDCARP